VITPLVRIAHANFKRAHLAEGLLLGGGRHPIETINVFGHCNLNRFHDSQCLLSICGRKSLLYERLAQGISQLPIHSFETTSPARTWLLLSFKGLVIEMEVFVR